MGWGRMMFMGNVGQQLDIQDPGNAVSQLQTGLTQPQNLDRRQERTLDELRNENHELKLYPATRVHLLVAKGLIKQAEVAAAGHAIDKP